MHIRPLQNYDISEVATIGQRAFTDDHRYLFTNPHLREHPSHFRGALLQRVKAHVLNPAAQIWVCVQDWRDAVWLPEVLQSNGEDPPRQDAEVILGYAVFIREGPQSDPTVRAWSQKHQDWTAALNRWLLQLESQYCDLFRLDKSLDMERELRWRQFIASSKPFQRLDNFLMLRGLAVDPKFQRRGVGKLLMKWGMDRAHEEGVPMALSASPVGTLLYRSLGFRTVRWDAFQKDDPGSVFCSMIWDWQGRLVRPVEAGSDEGWVDLGSAGRRQNEVVWK